MRARGCGGAPGARGRRARRHARDGQLRRPGGGRGRPGSSPRRASRATGCATGSAASARSRSTTRTGTLRAVGRLTGSSPAPSGRDGADVALDYARDHAAAFGLDGDDLDGLRLAGRSTARRRRAPHLGAALSRDPRRRRRPRGRGDRRAGACVTLTGPPAADLAVRSVEPALAAAAAYAAARRGLGAGAAPVRVERAGARRHQGDALRGRRRARRWRSTAAANGYRLGLARARRLSAPPASTTCSSTRAAARPCGARTASTSPAPASSATRRATTRRSPQALDAWLSSPDSLSGPERARVRRRPRRRPVPPGLGPVRPHAGGRQRRRAGRRDYQFRLTTFQHYATPNATAASADAVRPPPPPTPRARGIRAPPDTWAGQPRAERHPALLPRQPVPRPPRRRRRSASTAGSAGPRSRSATPTCGESGEQRPGARAGARRRRHGAGTGRLPDADHTATTPTSSRSPTASPA